MQPITRKQRRWLNTCRGLLIVAALLGPCSTALVSVAHAQGAPGTAAAPIEPRAYTLSYTAIVVMMAIGLTAACMPTIRPTDVAMHKDD